MKGKIDMEQQLHVWNVTETLLESRVIKIYGEIDTKLAHEVTSLLDVLSNDDPNTPIKLEICSPGGSVLDGLAIVDKIRSIKNPVIAFNTGYCASMATVISSVCDYAYGTENSSFLIHEVSSGCQGKLATQVDDIEFNKSLNKQILTIIASKCGKTYDELYDRFKYRDIWMSAKEALEYGLIDEISKTPKKNSKALAEFKKTFDAYTKK